MDPVWYCGGCNVYHELSHHKLSRNGKLCPKDLIAPSDVYIPMFRDTGICDHGCDDCNLDLVPVQGSNGSPALYSRLEDAQRTLWKDYLYPYFEERADWISEADPCSLVSVAARADDITEVFKLLDTHRSYLLGHDVIPLWDDWDVVKVKVR